MNHADLSVERWARFRLDQRILMIANEMLRGLSSLERDPAASLRDVHERVLRLVDLTVRVGVRRNLRRELLRWRGVVAELYLADQVRAEVQREALRALLQLDPEAAKQVAALGL